MNEAKVMAARAKNMAFLGHIVRELPAQLPILQEHLEDNEGELLPHLFIADIHRWAERIVKCEPDSRGLEHLLRILEQAWGEADPDITELISVSFLEHFARPGEPGSELRSMVGAGLGKQLHVIGW